MLIEFAIIKTNKRKPNKVRTIMEQEEKQKVAMLINSIFYFIQYGLIVNMPGDSNYRLLVIQNGQILTDEYYESVRGAKIAFSRMYYHRSWKEGVKPSWSHFYHPDSTWFETRIKNKTEEVLLH
jgi:hypothetical protein